MKTIEHLARTLPLALKVEPVAHDLYGTVTPVLDVPRMVEVLRVAFLKATHTKPLPEETQYFLGICEERVEALATRC